MKDSKMKSDKKDVRIATGFGLAKNKTENALIQFYDDFDDAFYRERAKKYDDCTLEERVYRAMVEPELAPYLKKGE